MVELSPKDSSILTRITRYRRIPPEERRALLLGASPKAREIGEIILGTSSREGSDSATIAAVRAYQKSFQKGAGSGRRTSLSKKKK